MPDEINELPAPLTPADCDLRDFLWSAIFRQRLWASTFHARATDSAWRAGVTLWLKSWEQVPAGSLPSDDIELCRIAELGRDLKTWRKVRDDNADQGTVGALHGWFLCSDGRLYHKTVAEGVNEAWARKLSQRERTLRARIAALRKRLSEAKDHDTKARITDELQRLLDDLPQAAISSVTESVTETNRQRPDLTGQGSNSLRADKSADVGGKKTRSRGVPLPEIPDALNTPEFCAAWAAFLKFRGESRFKVTSAAAVILLNKCLKWGIPAAIESIESSIAGSYRDLYPPRLQTRGSNVRNKPTAVERGEHEQQHRDLPTIGEASHEPERTGSGADPVERIQSRAG